MFPCRHRRSRPGRQLYIVKTGLGLALVARKLLDPWSNRWDCLSPSWQAAVLPTDRRGCSRYEVVSSVPFRRRYLDLTANSSFRKGCTSPAQPSPAQTRPASLQQMQHSTAQHTAHSTAGHVRQGAFCHSYLSWGMPVSDATLSSPLSLDG
jgi:hypothetical protein